MTAIDAAALVGCFEDVGTAMAAAVGHLSALDGVIGDADHGITMALGFSAVTQALAATPPGDPSAVFNTAAKSFLNAVGASSGPLYATAFMRAGAAVKGQAVLDRGGIVAVLEAMAKGIEDRGKAKRGDKTMVDAWRLAADAAASALAADHPLAACLKAAAEAAEAGAEATRAMLPGKGRAARLGERAVGHVDPGAASAAIILRRLADTLG